MSADPLIGWEFGKDLKPPKIDEYLGSAKDIPSNKISPYELFFYIIDPLLNHIVMASHEYAEKKKIDQR